MKPWFSKVLRILARDLRHDEVYEKAVGAAMGVGIVSVVFAESYPVPGVVAGTLAGMFAATCYFLRYYGPQIPDLRDITDENKHPETDTSPSVGKEEW
jgi:hypothetical protein